MQRSRWQFSLGTMLGGVVVVALGCLIARWSEGTYLLVTLAEMAALVLTIAHLGKVSRIRAASWLAAFYPWLVLVLVHLTGLVHWWWEQHPFAIATDAIGLVSWAGQLVRVVAVCLVTGTPIAGVACFGLAIGQAFLVVDRRPPDQGHQVARLILIPLFLWLGAFWMVVIEGFIFFVRD